MGQVPFAAISADSLTASTAPRTGVAVDIILEVRLEDWFQHEFGGSLHHQAVTNDEKCRVEAPRVITLTESQQKLRASSPPRRPSRERAGRRSSAACADRSRRQ